MAKTPRPGESAKSNKGRSNTVGFGAGGVSREADGNAARFAAISCGVALLVAVGEMISAEMTLGATVVASGAAVSVGDGVSVGTIVGVSVGWDVSVGVGSGVRVAVGAGVLVAAGVFVAPGVASTVAVALTLAAGVSITVAVASTVGGGVGEADPRSATLKVRENVLPRPNSSLYSIVIVFWPVESES